MGCVHCGRGLHQECRRCSKGKCHKEEQELPDVGETEEIDDSDDKQERSRRSTKGDLRDPKSTGRKRAAKIYPIDPSSPCEWRGLKNCGGGLRPVTGCYDGQQSHRHHGPVKNPTRNSEGNVHRICHDCHNHWHELNDLIYDEAKYNLLPHQPLPATEAELVTYKLKWLSGDMGREYELASSKNREKGRATQPTFQAPDFNET